MSDVRRACEALGEGPVTTNTFVRAVLRYPGWLVPASVNASGAALVGARQSDGSIWLEVFSERAILENAINGPKHAKLPTKLLTTGVVWASLVGDGLAGVVIDPGAPWSRRFEHRHIAALRRWARTLVFEDGIPVVTESLARYEAARRHETYAAVPAVLRALVDYPWYRVLRRRDGDQPLARVCPSRAHDDGAPFVAAFTADDCAERYRAALDVPDAWSIVERPGRALFGEIVDRDERGLALNTAGPAPTIALWGSSLRTLLEQEGHDEAPAGSAASVTAPPTHSLAAAFAPPGAKLPPPPSPPVTSGASTASGPTYRLLDDDRRWLATMFAEPFSADLLEDRDAFARDWQIVDREEPREPREPHRIILRHTSFAYLVVDLESRGGPTPFVVGHQLFEGEEARLRHLDYGFRLRRLDDLRRLLVPGAPAEATLRQAFGPGAREAPLQAAIPRDDGSTERYHRVLDGGVVVVQTTPSDQIELVRYVEGEAAFTLLRELHARKAPPR